MQPFPAANHLIQALPSEVYKRVRPALVYSAFAFGDVVYEPGERMEHVYFPTSVVVSLIGTVEDGTTAEVGLVGNEGVVGVELFLGGEVPVVGGALRMRAQALHDEFKRGGPFQAALLRYTQALITQISQTAVCNRLHPIEQRLARWLLMIHDRVRSDQVHMTHESLSHLLGVRREGVTLAAHHLQKAGLICYCHGRIMIVDLEGLEVAACECYRVVKNEFDRLLGQRTPLWRSETPLQAAPRVGGVPEVVLAGRVNQADLPRAF